MKNLQPGTVVFAIFALLSAIVCVVKGGVPIYAIEALMWLGLAVLWHQKQITNTVANYTTLSFAFVVLIGNAFTIGLGTGRQQGTEIGQRAGYKRGFAAGERIGYVDGMSDELGCVGLSNAEACRRVAQKTAKQSDDSIFGSEPK